MTSRSVLLAAWLLLAASLSAGCGSAAELPAVNEILAQPSTSLKTGDKISLTVNASGVGLMFEWTTLRGQLSDPTQPSVIYTAPDVPGIDTITVKITHDGGEIFRSITLDIRARPEPTMTITPVPEASPTAIPEPIACNSPPVTKNVFPQLSGLVSQTSFYGPVDESLFSCQAVYDVVHTQPLSVHLKYQNVGENFGWWGIATPDGFDATSFSELCFWAYARQPNQALRLKMKDMASKENGAIIILEQANQWTQLCTDLTIFANLGIRLDQLVNVNLGFEQPTGSAELWVTEFEFK